MMQHYCDIHAHFLPLLHHDSEAVTHLRHKVLFSAHSADDVQALMASASPYVYKSAGIHPQDPQTASIAYIEAALKKHQLHAVGEIGFDFSGHYKHSARTQEEIFIIQTELAIRYNRPVIIHSRKATHKIFEHIKLLKQCRGVVFHNAMLTLTESRSLLQKGVNAFFSIGTPLLWGAKVPQLLLREIAAEHLLLETDAPWQPVRGAAYTSLDMIAALYRKAEALTPYAPEEFVNRLSVNFSSLTAP
jgi:TatD DNase family protein